MLWSGCMGCVHRVLGVGKVLSLICTSEIGGGVGDPLSVGGGGGYLV